MAHFFSDAIRGGRRQESVILKQAYHYEWIIRSLLIRGLFHPRRHGSCILLILLVESNEVGDGGEMSSVTDSKLAQVLLSPLVGGLSGESHADGQSHSIPSSDEESNSPSGAVIEIPDSDSREIRYHQHRDAELIKLCLEEDREAWAALVERYSGLIYSIAWKSNLTPEDVADVFQSVSLALLEGLAELRDWTKLSAWLTQVTIHECMRVKRRRSRPVTSLEEVDEEVANIPDESILPDEMIQQLETQQLVQQALAMMDEPCRCLLTHLFFETEGGSYENIAEELGLSISTIGPKRGRCLKKLLQILQNLGL